MIRIFTLQVHNKLDTIIKIRVLSLKLWLIIINMFVKNTIIHSKLFERSNWRETNSNWTGNSLIIAKSQGMNYSL